MNAITNIQHQVQQHNRHWYMYTYTQLVHYFWISLSRCVFIIKLIDHLNHSRFTKMHREHEDFRKNLLFALIESFVNDR